MKVVYFIFFLVIQINISIVAQITIDCNFTKTDTNKSVLNIKILNNSDSTFYLPVSDWEVDGMVDSCDALLGFPDKTYIVNRLIFSQNSYKREGIPSYGDKGEFPDYEYFPAILKLLPNESRIINVEFSDKLNNMFAQNKYRMSFSIAYCRNKEWKYFVNFFGCEIDSSIIKNDTDIKISISNRREVIHWSSSKIKVKKNNSEMIRDAFSNWTGSTCN
jgi:hypothetical protein